MPTGACYTLATYCRHQPYRTWALGLGVTSLLCCSIFTGVPVMIVGYLCMQAANEGRATNKGVSIAGIIMGGISILLLIVYVATGQFTETFNTVQSS